MLRRRFTFALLCFIVGLFLAGCKRSELESIHPKRSNAPLAAEVADAIYFGGPIVTIEYATPTAEAVAVLDGRRFPNRDDLDRVSTEMPVMAIHISGHFASVNSKGLSSPSAIPLTHRIPREASSGGDRVVWSLMAYWRNLPPSRYTCANCLRASHTDAPVVLPNLMQVA